MGIVTARGGGPEELLDAYLTEAPNKGAGADRCEKDACSCVGAIGSVNRRGADGCEEDSGYSWAGRTLGLCPRNSRGLIECTTPAPRE